MCGICGVVALDQREDVGPCVARLMEVLAHRGPDGSGVRFVADRCAALGHRRLSIVDLATGAQPMANEDETVWVTYNGEIYNHRPLRAELERLGHRFRTQADTEVLVHGWEAWGPELLPRLNGIFAFALFDGRGPVGEIVLVRDPLGVKPLYLGGDGDRWWFASELAAARRGGLATGELRPEAIDEYLVYRFVPSPGTPYRAAWKLPPGHYCRLSLNQPLGTPTFQIYGDGFVPSGLPHDGREWAAAVRAGLRAAVRRQLMSDVPVGSLLSGGVDSTVVTRLMRDQMSEPPESFAIGFDTEGAGGELHMARAAAAALGVPLREVQVGEADYLGAWLSHVTSFGEPIANTGMLLVGLLCARVGKTHKVVLSGQGADEPLGGYPRHAAERLYPIGRRIQPLLRIVPEAWAEGDRMSRLRRVVAEPDRARRFAEILAVFSPREVGQLTGRGDVDRLVQPVRELLSGDPDGDALNTLLRVDTRLSLSDDLLLIGDHMSMASSVELRVPFLDLELLALVERMPSRYKLSWTGARKWLYRRAIVGLLPVELRGHLTGWRARAGPKLGFTTPLDRWVERWIGTTADGFLTGPEAILPQYTRADRIRSYVGEVRQRSLPRSRQLAALYVLESWLRGAVGASTPALP